jgi:cell division protein FtsQ
MLNRKNKNSKKNQRIFIAVIALLLLMIPFYIVISRWARSTSLFWIKTVEIKGNKSISEKDILSKLNIGKQTNLFVFETDSLKKVVEAHPQILSAEIDKGFPNKITVKIEERKPIAIINGKNSLYCIDRNRVVWEKNPDVTLDLPFISGIAEDSLSVGKPLNTSNITDFIDVINLTEDDKIISEVLANPKNEIIVYTLDEGYRANLGKNNFEKKLIYLNKILSELKNRNEDVDYIDLRFHKQAIVKIKE